MTPETLRILQLNSYDLWGGAEAVAANLQRGFRRRGHQADLAVGYKVTPDSDTLLVPNHAGRGVWYRFWRGVEGALCGLKSYGPGPHRRQHSIGRLADPTQLMEIYRGIESSASRVASGSWDCRHDPRPSPRAQPAWGIL